MDTRIVEFLEACYGEELSMLEGDWGAFEDRMTALMRQWGQALLQRMVSQHPLGY